MNPNVSVLLATYNGERFLRVQVDSILAQSYKPLSILARDDGSTDGTVAILQEYAARYPDRFRLLESGQPTGSAKLSFLAVLAASTAEYVAFADQDDLWTADKIAMEMAAMQRLVAEYGAQTPLLVFSDLRVVDERLETLHASFWKNQGLDPANLGRFERIVMQNVVTGCTALMNRSLAQRMLKMPEEAVMHDWWMALLASSFGASAVVDEATVFYRQHSANAVGAVLDGPPTGIPRWRYHEKRRDQWEALAHQAEALLRVHGAELTSQKRSLLEAVVRCETHPSRWVRTLTWLRHGLRVHGGLRPNLALLWYLWDMKSCKRAHIPASH